MCVTEDGKEVKGKKVKGCIPRARREEVQAKVKEEKWQRKMISNRWDDEYLDQGYCFAWLSCCKAAPTHVVVFFCFVFVFVFCFFIYLPTLHTLNHNIQYTKHSIYIMLHYGAEHYSLKKKK